ncbi:MAG: aminoglycoside phosphotransferase family protein [Actinomycetota bacterium]
MAAAMHQDEIPTSPALVQALLADQFPAYADLPVTPVPSAGTDNALFRIGDELSARLPRIGWAVSGVEKEYRWLPTLAERLPLPVPQPIAIGGPGCGYPCAWTICRWLPGENPPVGETPNPAELAVDLARFLRALQAIDVTDGPPCRRGVPVSTRDGDFRRAVAELLEIQAAGSPDDPAVAPILNLDLGRALAIWGRDITAEDWDRPPMWTHADLSPLNVLCDANGRLSAVIDFGTVGVGDPAVDAYGAWNLLDEPSRELFRDEIGFDDATWARGRAWALSIAMIQLPYYHRTNPGLTAVSHQVLRQILGPT